VGLWRRYRRIAQGAPALLIRGRVQNAEGVVSVVAEHLQRMDLRMASKSRDFR
jgi:error-prone DNA polymerase